MLRGFRDLFGILTDPPQVRDAAHANSVRRDPYRVGAAPPHIKPIDHHIDMAGIERRHGGNDDLGSVSANARSS